MKTLNDILVNQSVPYFPIKGQDGYGEKQDGSYVIYGFFRVWSRKEAKKIFLPDFVELNWAEYKACRKWVGAVGYWSNQSINKDEEEALLQSCDFINWV